MLRHSGRGVAVCGELSRTDGWNDDDADVAEDGGTVTV